MGKYSSIIMPIYTRWGAAVQKAYSAKPGDVATDIINLQTIDAEFKGAGLSTRTLKDVKKALSIVSYRKGDTWYCSLPAKGEKDD